MSFLVSGFLFRQPCIRSTSPHWVTLGFRFSLHAALHIFNFPTLGHSWFQGFSSGSRACFPLPHTESFLVSGCLFGQRCIPSMQHILWLLQIFTYMQTYAHRHAICIQYTCNVHAICIQCTHNIHIQYTHNIHTIHIDYAYNIHTIHM